MNPKEREDHLDVYRDRSELFLGKVKAATVFPEGPQSAETKKRYGTIVAAFEAGFFEKVYAESITGKYDISRLPKDVRDNLLMMVATISEKAGRALVGLVFLQLAIKAIAPRQSIRLHKGGRVKSDFSWREGISMRSLDKKYSSPFLRNHKLLEINRDGVMMTRTLAENYPYTQLYKARMDGPADQWMAIVDGIEARAFDPTLALAFLIGTLKNRSEQFVKLANETVDCAIRIKGLSLDATAVLLSTFVATTGYSARAFEVVMHSFVQALGDVGAVLRGRLAPLSQMRSANKKMGNIGDIELLSESGDIVESWDAKFGKPYLWDELVELGEKLNEKCCVQLAGFVTDGEPMLPNDLLNRKNEISRETGVRVEIFSFKNWVRMMSGDLSPKERKALPTAWLKAVAESFGRKRLEIAPIDEPCDAWIVDLARCLKKV